MTILTAATKGQNGNLVKGTARLRSFTIRYMIRVAERKLKFRYVTLLSNGLASKASVVTHVLIAFSVPIKKAFRQKTLAFVLQLAWVSNVFVLHPRHITFWTVFAGQYVIVRIGTALALLQHQPCTRGLYTLYVYPGDPRAGPSAAADRLRMPGRWIRTRPHFCLLRDPPEASSIDFTLFTPFGPSN